MTNDAPNSRPLTEDQLTDWVDGSMSSQQVQSMIAASGRSDLAQRVAQMQRHKVLLATTLPERAPRDLHDRVLAALERDMLLGAGEAERATVTAMPEPQLRLNGVKLAGDGELTTGRTIVRWLPRMAMAAGILLVAGGASFFVVKAVRMSSQPLANPTIAGNTRSEPSARQTIPSENKPLDGALAMREDVPATDAGEIAVADANTAQNATRTRAESASGASSVSTSSTLAMEQARALAKPGPEPIPVSLDRAASLAAQGRLAIRVLTDDTRGLAGFEQAGAAPLNSPQRSWRVFTKVPAQIVASVVPSMLPASSILEDPRAMAAELVAPMVGLTLDPLAAGNPGPLGRVRASYLVSVPATEAGLDVLRTALRARLKGAVEFFELPEAVQTPSVDSARDLLWWTQSPTQWVPRATVPTVVARP